MGSGSDFLERAPETTIALAPQLVAELAFRSLEQAIPNASTCLQIADTPPGSPAGSGDGQEAVQQQERPLRPPATATGEKCLLCYLHTTKPGWAAGCFMGIACVCVRACWVQWAASAVAGPSQLAWEQACRRQLAARQLIVPATRASEGAHL